MGGGGDVAARTESAVSARIRFRALQGKTTPPPLRKLRRGYVPSQTPPPLARAARRNSPARPVLLGPFASCVSHRGRSGSPPGPSPLGRALRRTPLCFPASTCSRVSQRRAALPSPASGPAGLQGHPRRPLSAPRNRPG